MRKNSKGLVMGFSFKGLRIHFYAECNYLLFWPADVASRNFWVQLRLQTKQKSFKGLSSEFEPHPCRRTSGRFAAHSTLTHW